MKLLKTVLLLCSCLATSAFGLGEDTLETGDYVTEGESHYMDGTISFEYEGQDTWTMTSTLVYGDHAFETTVYLEPSDDGEYAGSGKIFVRYDDDSGCEHRYGVSIKVEGDEIYLRENMPKYIPYNPNGPCTGAGPYEWFNHEEPYAWQEEEE